MARKIDIDSLHCLCSDFIKEGRVAYILYPMDGFLDLWIDSVAKKYGTTIVAITGMDWETVFSPWPAKGVPAGSPDFKGQSPEFLKKLREEVLPEVEQALAVGPAPERALVGVSMSGLFALWQWLECDAFKSIASLSGSFWYEGFMEWIAGRPIPHKSGRAFFLLGTQEAKSRVKAFNAVGANTAAIVDMLRQEGIDVEFKSVPGNHYSDPIPRLEAAFSALYTV
ncbi:MAG: alpha/beta hydrolase-fold protein [Muribaculaceae bacterium]|nr:alpha/beta hydrolase-fold protein [Muribaculaceae bacterium]